MMNVPKGVANTTTYMSLAGIQAVTFFIERFYDNRRGALPLFSGRSAHDNKNIAQNVMKLMTGMATPEEMAKLDVASRVEASSARTAADLHDLLVLRLAELHVANNSNEAAIARPLIAARNAILQKKGSRESTRLLVSALGSTYSFRHFSNNLVALDELEPPKLRAWRAKHELQQAVTQRQAEQAAEEQKEEGAVRAAAVAAEGAAADHAPTEGSWPRAAKRLRSGLSSTALAAEAAAEEADVVVEAAPADAVTDAEDAPPPADAVMEAEEAAPATVQGGSAQSKLGRFFSMLKK